MIRYRDIALMIVVATAACSDSNETSILLDVTYGAALMPDSFRMTANGVSDIGPPSHVVRVVVPDEWGGQSTTISLDAMIGEESIASGETALTLVAGEEVRGSVVLEKSDCPERCAPGSTRCESNGVSVCELGADGCTYWQEPIPCSVSAPYCSNGRCAAECEDECATGDVHCSGNATQACGESDNDTCLDWTTPTACSSDESCSNGMCGTTCSDECVAGTKRCGGNGTETCGDYDLDDCLDWSSPATCNQPPPATCLDANTLRRYSATGTCDASTSACTYVPTDVTCSCANNACPGEYIAIAAGQNTSCALNGSGSVECWGESVDYGGLIPPPAGPFEAIDGASSELTNAHFCALRANGAVACWGADLFNETLPPAGTYSQVSVGGNQSCGLRTNGTIVCWGSAAAPPTGTFSKIDVGSQTVCALAGTTLTCWGQVPTPPAGSFKEVAISEGISQGFICAIKTDETVTCWGGDNAFGERNAPTGAFASISAGVNHVCARRTDNTVACWGDNSEGQATPPAGSYLSVAAGKNHTCALTSAHGVVCWGDNEFGQGTAP